MQDKKTISRLVKLTCLKEDLSEALELLEISNRILQEKLLEFRKEILVEKDKNKVKKLMLQTNKLYRDYRITSNTIKNYMTQTYSSEFK